MTFLVYIVISFLNEGYYLVYGLRLEVIAYIPGKVNES